MTDTVDAVRDHLRRHFVATGVTADPDAASITFLGSEPIEVLRFAPGADGVVHYVSVGCAKHPMADPTEIVADPVRGPRAEVVLGLRSTEPAAGLARSLAVLAAAPAVDGMVLVPDALIDFSAPMWQRDSGPVPFTAVLLGQSEIAELPLDSPREPVQFFSATPITATEAAWVRIKGPEALRQAWRDDRVDVLDPNRRASQPS
ncbi:suppressor of fused domain protein [Mycolicibacillus parakoreensis]|uniref:Suppressor of fused domain protein n=1 Tax=Mycolicibacillus parakoreensis TaxID=1069221 RepID=A0ABY3U3A8_9MYCO|nr:suppressor of fused domain protein [Mycolicibacillus parakoreensis]MCV7314991.1 suppressor of fused domain protein [Mycolicibacillus parakoreensis]ULN53644.1 suppressor of fused domain protein [Mycolicibacillus parakoreensis]